MDPRVNGERSRLRWVTAFENAALIVDKQDVIGTARPLQCRPRGLSRNLSLPTATLKWLQTPSASPCHAAARSASARSSRSEWCSIVDSGGWDRWGLMFFTARVDRVLGPAYRNLETAVYHCCRDAEHDDSGLNATHQPGEPDHDRASRPREDERHEQGEAVGTVDVSPQRSVLHRPCTQKEDDHDQSPHRPYPFHDQPRSWIQAPDFLTCSSLGPSSPQTNAKLSR